MLLCRHVSEKKGIKASAFHNSVFAFFVNEKLKVEVFRHGTEVLIGFWRNCLKLVFACFGVRVYQEVSRVCSKYVSQQKDQVATH